MQELNWDMVVSVAEFLDDDDLEMDKNGGVTSKHMKSLENVLESFKGIAKNWLCLDLILLVIT